MDFGTILRDAASRHATSVAVWCDGDEQRYDELYSRACRLAQGLGSLDLQAGDRVAVLGPNNFHTPEQIAGIALGGYVRAALYAHETAAVNAYLIELVGARALVVHADAYAALAAVLGELECLEHVVVYVYLAAGQLTHAAVVFFWPILQVGARIVVLPTFEPGRVLDLIETQRVTVTLMVPTMIQALVGHPGIDERDLSSLRCVNYAAAPIAPSTLARAVEVFGETLFHMYAQSEIPPMIISGGYNIWPAQLEDVLAEHPAVAEVCVVGVAHERWGETTLAAIVLHEGSDVGEAELIEFCRERVGSVKKVTRVELVDQLPRSPLGKVLRRQVRERFWTGQDQIQGA